MATFQPSANVKTNPANTQKAKQTVSAILRDINALEQNVSAYSMGLQKLKQDIQQNSENIAQSLAANQMPANWESIFTRYLMPLHNNVDDIDALWELAVGKFI